MGRVRPGAHPAPVIARFHEALVAVFREERVARQFAETQQARLVLAGPEELGRFLGQQVETRGHAVLDNNIQAD